MSQTVVNLGYVLKNRGEYIADPETKYYKDNVVQYQGSAFIADPVGYDLETNPLAYVTGAPYDTDPNQPNEGWKVFASDAAYVNSFMFFTENPEWAYVVCDSEDKILFGVKQDGEFYFGTSCPPQIREYVEQKISEASPENYEQVLSFLDGYIGGDKTLQQLLNEKLNSEGLNPDALGAMEIIDNPEWIDVKTDSENKILEGIKTDGTKVIGGNLQVNGNIINEGIQGQIEAAIEEMQEDVNKMLEESSEKLSYFESVDNPEFIQATTDSEGRIVEGIRVDGTKYIPYLENERINNQEAQIEYIKKDIFDMKSDASSMKTIHKASLEAVNSAKLKFDSYGQQGEDTYISLLQMTDSHTDITTIKRGFELANSRYFDVLVHTGDIVELSNSFTQVNWENSVLNSIIPVLSISGNHEVIHKIGTIDTGFTDDEIYDCLYNPTLLNHNAEIHPEIGGKKRNYFYKDISKKGHTTRVIGLYQFEWNPPTDGSGQPIYGEMHGKDIVFYTQEQIDWFIDLLDKTPSDYDVIILSHVPLSRYNFADSPFSAPNSVEEESDMWCFLSNKYFFFDIIDAFVNGTTCQTSSDQITSDGVNTPISVNFEFTKRGKFVANVCGHHHSGGLLLMKDREGNNTPYRIVMSPCTSSNDVQNTGLWSRKDNRTTDCLNAIVYDYNLDKVIVVRIGSDVSKFMKDAKYYMY